MYVPGRNLRVDAAVRALSPGDRLLDLGCGAGTLGLALRGKFREVYGIDISMTAVQAARDNGILASQLDLSREPLPYEDCLFDAVTLLAVLPYVYDPPALLLECFRVLRPGGQVVLSAANMRTLGKLFRLFFAGRFPTTSKLAASCCDGGAMHYFCSQDLSDLLAAAGFVVLMRNAIFFRPELIALVPDKLPVLGRWKAEFFGGETFLTAGKPDHNPAECLGCASHRA